MDRYSTHRAKTNYRISPGPSSACGRVSRRRSRCWSSSHGAAQVATHPQRFMLLTNARSTMEGEPGMGSTSLRIAVNAATTGEANRLTTELEQWLKGRVEDLQLSRVKENAETQDAGTILVAVLTAPAMVEFAKGP